MEFGYLGAHVQVCTVSNEQRAEVAATLLSSFMKRSEVPLWSSVGIKHNSQYLIRSIDIGVVTDEQFCNLLACEPRVVRGRVTSPWP